MPRAVKNQRSYDVSGRQEQALQRRRAIRAAAKELFLDNGYAATPVKEIARKAGVSEALVYVQFGTKVGLLKEVYDVTLAGDDDPTPILQRSQAKRWEKEADPAVILREYAASVRSRHEQLAPLHAVIDGAAAVDPEARALRAEHDAQRWRGMRVVATNILRTGGTASGLGVDDIAAQLWLLNSHALYQLCTTGRGWNGDRYQAWLVRTWNSTLLRQAP